MARKDAGPQVDRRKFLTGVAAAGAAGALAPHTAILPEADLADIHAYVASLPAARDYKTIPLLNP